MSLLSTRPPPDATRSGRKEGGVERGAEEAPQATQSSRQGGRSATSRPERDVTQNRRGAGAHVQQNVTGKHPDITTRPLFSTSSRETLDAPNGFATPPPPKIGARLLG